MFDGLKSKIFQQDNAKNNNSIKIQDFDAALPANNDHIIKAIDDIPKCDKIIRPVIFDQKYAQGIINGVGFDEMSDSNLEVSWSKSVQDIIDYSRCPQQALRTLGTLSDFNFNNFIYSLHNIIFEIANLNFCAMYDSSSFGSSEVGIYFDIKRRFFEEYFNDTELKCRILERIGVAIEDMSNQILDNVMETGTYEFPLNLKGFIDNAAVAISQRVSMQMAKAIHEGLSNLLCDIVGTPNLEYIYDLLANSSTYLKENRNNPTFGVIATQYIENYFYERLYNLTIGTLNQSYYDLLDTSVATLFYSYTNHIYSLNKSLNKQNPNES